MGCDINDKNFDKLVVLDRLTLSQTYSDLESDSWSISDSDFLDLIQQQLEF